MCRQNSGYPKSTVEVSGDTEGEDRNVRQAGVPRMAF